MTPWNPLSREEIEAELARAVTGLHPAHAKCFSAITVPIRSVPVAAYPGERVWVVAEHQGRILYYSDIEQGWAIERPDGAGGIADRDCNQFELPHLMCQLFGDPQHLTPKPFRIGANDPARQHQNL